MMNNFTNAQALDLLRLVTVDGVRNDSPDLTARQLAVLLTVYVTPGPHTVRGLAAGLNVTKPAITRALDRLGQLDMIKRQRDEENKRSVLVQRTVAGSGYLQTLSAQIQKSFLEVQGTTQTFSVRDASNMNVPPVAETEVA
jgi:DNA-binding MarR family transcriptional regulator